MAGDLKGPWRCSVCGRVYGSLDESLSGNGVPGSDIADFGHICKSCYSVLVSESSLPGDECWI